MENIIQPCTTEHINHYGEIYEKAFSGEPWNDNWTVENARIHVGEILESKQSYGLEYVLDGEIVGFILGSSMLLCFGRIFEINDLAVHPDYQGRGIAKELLARCLEEMKQRKVAGVHLITQQEGFLPEFYERYGFKKETELMLMGMEL